MSDSSHQSKELHRLQFHLPHLSHAQNELPQVQRAALVNIHLRCHKGHDKVTHDARQVAKNPTNQVDITQLTNEITGDTMGVWEEYEEYKWM